MLMRFVDTSGRRLTERNFEQFEMCGFKAMCYRLHGGWALDRYARSNLQLAQAMGFPVSGYVWITRGKGRKNVVDSYDSIGHEVWDKLAHVVIDCEERPGFEDETPLVDDIWSAVHNVEALRQKAVIYTAPYFWRDTMRNPTVFSKYPLWCSSWTGDGGKHGVIPQDLSPRPFAFGGWTSFAAQQYAGDYTDAGILVDANICDPSFFGLADMMAAGDSHLRQTLTEVKALVERAL